MTIIQALKKNKLLVIVILIYMVLFALIPDMAYKALSNSIYYIVELIQVLPVVFLLTVVIEALIPKKLIMKHFGEDSGLRGNLIALLLGSISAGPIYAAFPISKTLLKKGASVSNIIIILCSWAVIKIPMLANEAKFLGVSFMWKRWILTVIAIFLMAWIVGKIVKKKEILLEFDSLNKNKVYVNEDYCSGCGICTKNLPEVFEMIGNKAIVKASNINFANESSITKAIEKCPINAIVLNLDG